MKDIGVYKVKYKIKYIIIYYKIYILRYPSFLVK